MKTFLTLLQREWLQHRFGWSLLAGIPLALALLLLSVGQIQFDHDPVEQLGSALPVALTLGAMAATPLILLTILWGTSLILMTSLARRDHQDRSIEFWMSMPVSHSASLGAPLLTHLLLVPIAALVVGLAGGWLVSLVLVTRLAGFGAWLSLPWADLLPAVFAGLLRVAAGVPLALLWLSPIIGAVVLFGAWFRRWGLPVLLASIGIASLIQRQWFGSPSVGELIGSLFRHAGQSLAVAGRHEFDSAGPDQMFGLLQELPRLAKTDLGMAAQALGSPLWIGAAVVAAACFVLLVDWRQRGAGVAG